MPRLKMLNAKKNDQRLASNMNIKGSPYDANRYNSTRREEMKKGPDSHSTAYLTENSNVIDV